MDERFADWYRLADPDPRSETLANRWGVIHSQAGAADVNVALDLVRLFTGMRQSDVASAPAFVGAFKEADPALPMRNNDLLVQILAGATLSQALTYGDPVADVAALALRSIHFAKTGRESAIPDVMEDADEYLASRSREVRIDAAQEAAPVNDVEKQLSTIEYPSKPQFTRINSYHNYTYANDAFEKIENITAEAGENFEILRSVVAQLAKQVVQIRSEAPLRTSRQWGAAQEELNILWWLFGESSRDLGVPASEVGLEAFSIMAGKELADLTTQLPGVVAAEAMLHRALRATGSTPSTSLGLKSAVEATSEEWRRGFVTAPDVAPSDLREITPVHLAVRHSLEHGNAWPTTFRKVMGVKKDPNLSAVELASQVYTERLLARAIRIART